MFSHQKIFRQINSLLTCLVKPLLSRNFCQKCVRENSRNFHTVWHSVEKQEIISRQKNISSNQLFSNFHGSFAKNAWEGIPVISTLCVAQWRFDSVGKNLKFTLTLKIVVKTINANLTRNLTQNEYFQMMKLNAHLLSTKNVCKDIIC